MSTELEPLDDEQKIDWETYKKTSLFPGGFGEERQRIWPKLLGIPDTVVDDNEGISQDAHDDERQIRLDTDRSFVLYPVDDEKRDREELQQELNQLLVSLFRKRPKLSYFQGYHDIITVLFLTLPSELQLACAEKLSLHRIRDSMGVGLEPVLGLVRVMQNLLRVADPDYSQLLERVSPLPFYALSNILTLFSHDMPTLRLIQHVFDYLLCRPPVIIVYLAAAVILARKDEVRILDEEDEDGMIHSLLNSLPNITDDIVEEPSTERELSSLLEEPLQEEIKPEPEAVSLASPVKPETSGEDTVQEKREDEDELNLLSLRERDEPPLEEPLSDEKTSPSKPKLTISLSPILLHADFLYESYPPTHPSLALSSIMGPNSVVHTWAASISGTLSDDEAEDMVRRPEQIVFPPQPEIAEKEEDAIQVEKARRKRRKLVKKRRTIVMAAVVVLGIAMAIYGTRNGTIRSGDRFRTTGGERQFRKIEGWMRNFVLGGAAWVLDIGRR